MRVANKEEYAQFRLSVQQTERKRNALRAATAWRRRDPAGRCRARSHGATCSSCFRVIAALAHQSHVPLYVSCRQCTAKTVFSTLPVIRSTVLTRRVCPQFSFTVISRSLRSDPPRLRRTREFNPFFTHIFDSFCRSPSLVGSTFNLGLCMVHAAGAWRDPGRRASSTVTNLRL
jgi:hypothetical protein